MDFIADILAKLDDQDAKTKLDNLTKKQTVDLEVRFTGNTDISKAMQKNLSSLNASASKTGKSVGKSYNTALQTQIESMARTQRNAFSEPLKNITKEQQSYVNFWEKELNKQEKKSKSFSQLDAKTASNKTLSWLKNNSKAAKDYGDILTNLAQKQLLATNSDELKAYTKEVNSYIAEAKALGKTGRGFFDEIGNSFKRIGQFTYTYGIIQQIPNAISQSVSELKQMDDILTEISKTSNLTTSQLKELGSTSFDSASKYGKKASDYLTGIQEMSRSGYYGEQAKQMANLSVLAQAAGDIDANMANSYLLASNAAYQYQGNVEKLNALLDGQNMINRMVMPCRKLMAS